MVWSRLRSKSLEEPLLPTKEKPRQPLHAFERKKPLVELKKDLSVTLEKDSINKCVAEHAPTPDEELLEETTCTSSDLPYKSIRDTAWRYYGLKKKWSD